MKVSVFWFRRDLRLNDNKGLLAALKSGNPVLPLFIFDENILGELKSDDPRVTFIHESLSKINKGLNTRGSALLVRKGDPASVWHDLLKEYEIAALYINKDYEPYAIGRDNSVEELLRGKGIRIERFRDQVIFEENDILKPDNKPYTVFTPYSRRWLQRFKETFKSSTVNEVLPEDHFLPFSSRFPSLEETGFTKSNIHVRPWNPDVIPDYHQNRDIPAADGTSFLSPHLRFGTVSIREIAAKAAAGNPVFLNELIWREFFMQILFHFPHVVTGNFRKNYDDIRWNNDEKEFQRWCAGETGYPIVDAGMRQLNETGFMHNRVRMITAGFLCKHLLIDWRWGEAYFAEKLLDYELSSNNGNWQWAAGTGCDAAPYFRVFNPDTQQKRFDPQNEYVKKWGRDFGMSSYPRKMVDHDLARLRAIETYKAGIKKPLYK